MKVAIVLDDYPTLSQSFINRLIDELSSFDNVHIDILTVNEFNQSKLKFVSKTNYDLLKNGSIKVKGYSKTKGVTFYMKLSLTFFKYFIKVFLKKEKCIPIQELLKINPKYHIKGAMLGELLDKEQYDVIHPQFLTIAIYTILAKNVYENGKVCAYGRGSDVSNRTSLLPEEVSLIDNHKVGVSKYFFVSKSLMDMAIQKGISAEKCSILYSGMDINEFKFNDNKVTSSKNKINLLQVGRLVDKKGILLTIEMLSRITDEISFKLTIIGDGPLYGPAYQLCKEKNLLDHVVFLGSKTSQECIQAMSKHDILLVPSLTGPNGDSEGIPNVAKEAMALGCIVLSSDHSGLKELISNGVNGYLFQENNIDDYMKKFRLAVSNSDKWSILAKNARSKVEKEFCINKLSKKLVEHYHQLK